MVIVLVIERTRSSPDSSPRFTFVYSIRQGVGRLSGEIGMKRLVPFHCPSYLSCWAIVFANSVWSAKTRFCRLCYIAAQVLKRVGEVDQSR